MKANKINIDDFINDTITELQKHESPDIYFYKMQFKYISEHKTKERKIKQILRSRLPFISLLKDSNEYFLKYKDFFNSNGVYINEIGTKGKSMKVFLFDGRSYELSSCDADEVRFYLYDTVNLTIKKEVKPFIYICAFDNTEVTSFKTSDIYAYNSANIKAFECSCVSLYDNTTAHVFDYTEVHSSKSKDIFAYNNTRVNVRNNTNIMAFNNSIIFLYDNNCNATAKTFDNVKILCNYYANGTIMAHNNTSVINKSKDINIIAHDNTEVISVKNDNIIKYDNSNLFTCYKIKEINENSDINEIDYKDITILNDWYISSDGRKYSFYLCSNKVPNYNSYPKDKFYKGRYNYIYQKNITEYKR